ncbi:MULTISPECIES: hypothetical protein [Bacillaceae]|uniref:hypothetical protein n=1 Tax=Bacillaceae TaxID=186817 RepID=UPI000BFC28C3|nr:MULTISPECIES: hypothetical protein [Bacillaceae]MBY0155429.1 hypothetical protein [Cytobacillus firmus]MCM3032550.1 hypothetical protein [Niallia sp. MER 6]PGT80973.1 hypothetical protein COD11_19180 [Bacillus sp. AFS040349]
MDQDQVKQALLEMIDSSGRRGRKWFFPKNVDNQYKILANMTLKEILIYILPALLISIGIGFIPPYNSMVFWLIKAIFIVLIIVIPVVYVNYRPVKFRDNIRSKDFIKEFLDYRKKKKIYFVKPKNTFLD